MNRRDIKAEFPSAFPTLDDEQLDAFLEFAERKTYHDGEFLFAAGERELKFHVIKSGEVEIVDESGSERRSLLVHEEREFTGDLANFTGRPANVSGIARGEVEVYEISAEKLQRIISERPGLSDLILRTFIARWQILHESDYTGLLVIGSRFSRDTFRIRDFLAKNHVLFTWDDLERDPQVDELLRRFEVSAAEMPVVAYGNEWLLRNPSNRELAERVGLSSTLDLTVYDFVIVGGGPAGLAAAVYGASEGLHTLVLEQKAPGGQAGASSKIENYLGFPTGVSGEELAERAVLQARKFGAQFSTPSRVTKLEFDGAYPVLHLYEGERVSTKCLLIATGADYRKLDVEGRERFDGAGVYYAATHTEALMCRASPVVVVGGGNSAGQAAVFLSEYVSELFLLIRGDDLGRNMSRYLVQRIEQTANIELLTNTEIDKMGGRDYLEGVEIRNNQTGEVRAMDIPAVFSFIGATPRTDWLPPQVETDDRGFIKTGSSISNSPSWPMKRQPFLLETSRPGVFAAGDVRSGSAKRVAAAVGEGAMAVQFVHEYLQKN
jgi:thioredoxin reductase (NADPH)